MQKCVKLLLLLIALLLTGCRSDTPAPSPVPTPISVSTPAPTPTPADVPISPPATEPVQPTPVQEQTCTISITCAELLAHLEELDEDKRDLVPEDGNLLAPVEAAFTDGETVFDVLQRTCRDLGIHLEFSITPAYHSTYVEGIGNLYETDCGPLSGWSYTVNDRSPNYGCNQYVLESGDSICWAYHCDLSEP